MIHIVLHEPEIPFNTGAIARTCVATDTALDMIKPYGFVINDKMIRRAGMDYWPKVNLHEYVDFEDFLLHTHPAFPTRRENDSKGQRMAEIRTPTGFSGQDTGSGQNDHAREAAPRLWFATTKAHQLYTDVRFGPDDYIMFGKESAGIPEQILVDHEESCIRIPMWGDIRSLNLSNSVAIILYEALRQNGFAGLTSYGELHHLHWKR